MENIKNWFLQTSAQIQHHNTISEKLFQKELSKNKIVEIILEYIPKNIPILSNFPSGHIKNNQIFPIGKTVQFCTRKKILRLIQNDWKITI